MAAASLNFKPNDERPIKLFFEDEGRFGRSNNLSRCWSKKGTRARVCKQIVRQYTYAYASICPETGENHSLVISGSDTEIMNYYLADLSKEFRHYRIILCADNAGWHKSSSLIIPENIVFLYLPPYSPELNPVEHLWDYIREQKGFNNRIMNSMSEIIDTLADALKQIKNEKEIIKSMCNFHWLL